MSDKTDVSVFKKLNLVQQNEVMITKKLRSLAIYKGIAVHSLCKRYSDCWFLLQSVNNYSGPVLENLWFAKACGYAKGTTLGYSIRCDFEWRV